MKDSDRTARRLPRALGLVSVGLGMPQLVVPKGVARAAGVDDAAHAPGVIRAVGVRELVQGAALLAGPPQWMWARVVGDAMDLSALGVVLAGGTNRDGRRQRRLVATTAVVGAITAVDVIAAVRSRRGDQHGVGRPGPLRLRASVTVGRAPHEVYARWRDLEQLPMFMRHVESVTPLAERRWHWVVSAPLGSTVEWDAELTSDDPGHRLSWRSLPGADVDNSGTVHFAPAPGGRGTEVRVVLHYDVPGGLVGTALAKVFGEEPEQQVRDDLRRFKQILETGRLVRSDAMPAGTDAAGQLAQRAARPHDTEPDGDRGDASGGDPGDRDLAGTNRDVRDRDRSDVGGSQG